VFASRRGNWEAMVRGLFTNRTVVNLLDKTLPAGATIHASSGDVLPLWQAAKRYETDNVPVVVFAGERYGAGSSRDWAAKGVALLGARAVLASSFERIHRSNLIGMGVVPLFLPVDQAPEALALSVDDWIDVDVRPELLSPRGPINVRVLRSNGEILDLQCRAAIETEQEIALLKAGGIMPFILRRALDENPSSRAKTAAIGQA